MPAEKIIVLPFPGGVTSTFDEASAVRQYVAAHQTYRIILVTSAFHTRRARWIFEKVLAGLPVRLEMVAVPYAGFDQTNWWKNETGLITLNNEYIKWFYYLFKYRLRYLYSLTLFPIAPIMLPDVALRPVPGLELGI